MMGTVAWRFSSLCMLLAGNKETFAKKTPWWLIVHDCATTEETINYEDATNTAGHLPEDQRHAAILLRNCLLRAPKKGGKRIDEPRVPLAPPLSEWGEDWLMPRRTVRVRPQRPRSNAAPQAGFSYCDATRPWAPSVGCRHSAAEEAAINHTLAFGDVLRMFHFAGGEKKESESEEEFLYYATWRLPRALRSLLSPSVSAASRILPPSLAEPLRRATERRSAAGSGSSSGQNLWLARVPSSIGSEEVSETSSPFAPPAPFIRTYGLHLW